MAVELGIRNVTWTVDYWHSAQITVTRVDVGGIWFLDASIASNGELSATMPLGGFSVGQVVLSGGNPIPEPASGLFPFAFTFAHPGGSFTGTFGLGPGTHTLPFVGQLVITAPCRVLAQWQDASPTGFHGYHPNGHHRELPNVTDGAVWLQLTEPASWSLVTTHGTWTGTTGAAGQDLQNYLAAVAYVKAISGSAPADGRVDVTCSLETYAADTVSASWSEAGGTCSGYAGAGYARAMATPASTTMTSEMTMGWRLQRQAAVLLACLHIGGGPSAAESAEVLRYGDDPAMETITLTDGVGSTTVQQRWWQWAFAAARAGGGTGGDSGAHDSWGPLSCRLTQESAGAITADLPEAYGDGLGYRTWKDRRMAGRCWTTPGPTITQAAALDQRIGWHTDYDAVDATTRTAVQMTPPGAWTLTGGKFGDITNGWTLTPDAGIERMTARRTLTFDVGQLNDPPTRGLRPVFAGWRYLDIHLQRHTGTPPASDTVTVRIKQANLAELFPDPEHQTWTRTEHAVKTWTATVQYAVDGHGYVRVDLLRPDMHGGAMLPDDPPPPVSNHGALAAANVQSRWPQPTYDGLLTGVTLPEWIELELDATGTWPVWRLGSMELVRGAAPVFWAMPALNQWVREERHDRLDEDDTTQFRRWRRRYITGFTDNALGLELFDVVRTSHRTTNELGQWDMFDWDLQTITDLCDQVTEARVWNLWETVDGAHVYTPIGAAALWPGFSCSLPTADPGSVAAALLAGPACWIGGAGMVWTGDSPVVQAGVSGAFTVQALVDSYDWFGGCGDVFGLGDSTFTWRAGCLAHGVPIGTCRHNADWELDTDDATLADGTTGTSDAFLADTALTRGYRDHRLVSGRRQAVWSGPTTDWLIRPSLESTTIYTLTEAPLWWHTRGVHLVHWWYVPGPPRWRFRGSDGKPLCNEGRCTLCRQGR